MVHRRSHQTHLSLSKGGLFTGLHEHAKLEGNTAILSIRVDTNLAGIQRNNLFANEESAIGIAILAAIIVLVTNIEFVMLESLVEIVKCLRIEVTSFIYDLYLELGLIFIIGCKNADWLAFAHLD